MNSKGLMSMGFKYVYRSLQEVFPEIDSRILRAVAIEHSKDVDAAVNNILTEVIPYMAGPSNACANSAEVVERTNVIFIPTPLVPESPNRSSAPISSFNGASKNDQSGVETGGHDDAFASSNSAFTQSGQRFSTDFLDDIIENAKNNKKTLFSVMDTVMNMMKEVELQERAAKLAKEEAALGGIEILAKVEQLKQMLAHAKEANDKHAGEVYGEKAILATEARELQSRLFCLSDERDKSLATLDEMRQTLEARLAAAEELKKASEQDKLGKEESARNALTEQEAIMAKVVQESKLLEEEAEENAKLRDYLVDRGYTVDALQGEISVICQDVRLLKEKFNNCVPLSMSVSSSQTTCKLASSSSSMRSMSSVLVPEEQESSSHEEGSTVSSVGDVPLEHGGEDGWDILDNDMDII